MATTLDDKAMIIANQPAKDESTVHVSAALMMALALIFWLPSIHVHEKTFKDGRFDVCDWNVSQARITRPRQIEENWCTIFKNQFVGSTRVCWLFTFPLCYITTLSVQTHIYRILMVELLLTVLGNRVLRDDEWLNFR